MRWDPQVYGQFGAERDRPFHDLVSRIDAPEARIIVDLGCGPGTLTATLAHRWPQAQIHGFDSSPEMITRAESRTTNRLRFGLLDAADYHPDGSTDVLLSNALLQWVPNHLAVLDRWAGALRPGAWLAWQVPGNFDAPSHRLMRDLAGTPRWNSELAGVLRGTDTAAEPTDYLDLLLRHGFAAQVWETTYFHLLSGPDPVLRWVRGTALRPVLAALPPADAVIFESECAELLRIAYPTTEAGTVFEFRRLFCVGQKSEAPVKPVTKLH